MLLITRCTGSTVAGVRGLLQGSLFPLPKKIGLKSGGVLAVAATRPRGISLPPGSERRGGGSRRGVCGRSAEGQGGYERKWEWGGYVLAAMVCGAGWEGVSWSERSGKASKPCTVLAWGGGLSGALGNGGTRNEPRPLAVTALPPDVCIVSCGDSWSAACTESGTLYTWGKGQYGRLGHGDVSDVTVPRRMTALDGRRVVSLATGGCHGAVVVEGGDVFAWGRNWHGELGVSDTKAGSAPVIVSMDEGVRAAAVAAGARHTLVLDETGQVWACGQCADGQLGTGGRDKAVSKMTLVPLPSGAKATQVACGRDFSIVVLADGRVLSCGADDYGQLGQGKANRYESSMREIKHLQGIHVQSVSCGDYHVAACDRQGRVYAWGYGRFGQLGTGATTDLSVPTLVPNLENITSVSCGQNHAAAITRKGGLFVWGKGREGQLGRGDELESPVAYRTVPMAVDAIPSSCRVHQVSCGASHTLCTVAC